MEKKDEELSEASALLRILEMGRAEIVTGEYQLASEYFAEQKSLRSARPTHGGDLNPPRRATDANK